MDIKQGDIYIVSVDDSLGSEQNYKNGRPALIVQNNIGNNFSTTTIIAPLTKQTKKPMPTHYLLKKENYPFLKYDSLVLCEQIRVVDKNARKTERKIGHINKQDLSNILHIVNKNFYT